MRPESDARSSSPLRIHLLAMPSDAIGVRAIFGIKHRISYSKTEPQLDSSLVSGISMKQFRRQIEPTLAVDRCWTFSVHKSPVM
jgi:hypothetical protein